MLYKYKPHTFIGLRQVWFA